MHPPDSFEQAVSQIVIRHPEFPAEAYTFVRDALSATVHHFRNKSKDSHHLSAEELFYGSCMFAIQSYGPLANEVLFHWNIKSSSDIGDIVYHLIEAGVFGKQKGDRREQFDGLPDLELMLSKPFDAHTIEDFNV